MANLGGFDASAKENQRQSSCVPAGQYVVVLVASEKKRTNDGTGEYLKTDFQIVSGEFQNRHIFQNLNVWLEPRDDKKRTAIQIAKGQLSELCRAVGVLTPRDSSELHGIPIIAKVNVRDSDEYGPQNNIVKFMPMQAPMAMKEKEVQEEFVEIGDNPWVA